MAQRGVLVRVLSFFWRGLDGVRKILHLLLLLLLLALVVGAFSPAVPQLPGNAALLVRPIGYLVEELEGDAYARAIDELQGTAIPQTLLRDVVDSLRYAAKDDNVPAVVLELDSFLGAGMSKLQTVAAAIDEVKAAGKPVYAYASYFSQSSYYLASNADHVWMNPQGGLLLTGFSSYRNYYKQALDTLAIEWNVFRVGDYKSYAEPYLRNDMSDEDRSSTERWLGSLWSAYVADVAEARSIPESGIEAFANELGNELAVNDVSWGELAVSTGLVDRLVNKPEFREALIAEFGASDDDEAQFKSVPMRAYLAGQRLLETQIPDEAVVAVVIASGPVVNGEAAPGQIGGDSTAALIREARLDPNVKALVLRVDSGGGSVFAADVIQAELQAFKASGKPFVASMSSVAASAGYWISAGADKIFASPTTITGSIGVVGMFPTFQNTLAKIGVHTDGVGTTDLSGQLRPDRAMNEPARKIFQQLIDKDYDRFISGVAEYRGLAKERVDAIAQGRVWSGADALDLQLIDAFGGLDDAISQAAQLADLGEVYRVDYQEQTLTPFEQMVLDLTAGGAHFGLNKRSDQSSSGAKRLLQQLEATLNDVARFNDPRGVYSECFCNIR
ncbi:MAG: signal peptide peptidase SppA [Pseudomonadota bacterium]